MPVFSPAHPESAKTASSPMDAPYPQQGRSSADDPRSTFHGCYGLFHRLSSDQPESFFENRRRVWGFEE